jgi:hemoglobin
MTNSLIGVPAMIDNSKTPYEQLGGGVAVRAIVERFYDLMDSLSEASGIRALHAKSLRGSREKLFLFLSGWLGGPDLYQQKYGDPFLRRRHLGFPIGAAERDQWLLCMGCAVDETEMPQALRAHLKKAFLQVPDHIRNRPEPGTRGGIHQECRYPPAPV